MSSIRYRAEIDGLRAIAVLSVVLYHARLTFIPGGFVGVDIFFVISGFLITSILYREMADRDFAISAFYERRVRRLLPALFAVIIVSGIVSWFVLLPDALKDFGESAVWTMLFVSNVFFWLRTGDYFNAPAETKPLLHTWSLGVEEQFYIFFPIFLLIVMRLFHRRAFAPTIIATFLVSFAVSIWAVRHTPVAAFYLAPSRAWELMLGAILALPIVPELKHEKLQELASAIGLVLIVLSVGLITSSTPFPGLTAMVPCLGAALIIYANGSGSTWTGRWLAMRPVVFVGLISYSLYLVHWPVFVFYKYVKVSPLTATDTAICLAASLGLAVLSWRYVERPFRKRSLGWTRVQIFSYAATGMLFIALAGGSAVWLKGMPGRLPENVVSLLDLNVGDRRVCHDALRLSQDELCVRGAEGQSPTFILVGDSHAGAMAPALFKAAEHVGHAGFQFTQPGYNPSIGYVKWGEPEKFRVLNRRLVAFLTAHEEVRQVFVVVYWFQAVEGNRYISSDGDLVSGKEAVSAGLKTLVSAFPDRQFVLFQAPPHSPEYGYDIEARRRLFNATIEQSVSRADYLSMRKGYQAILDMLAKSPNVSLIDPIDVYCGSRDCPGILNGEILYRDDNHLSVTGAYRITPLFEKFWNEAEATPGSEAQVSNPSSFNSR